MTELANQYFKSDGPKKENMRRVELIWQLLAVGGNARAMCNIGLMYKNGIGVAKDSRLARQWYERADAAGCKDASKALAELAQ
jgi:TPR repeat protein